jgi:hypothetical protein
MISEDVLDIPALLSNEKDSILQFAQDTFLQFFNPHRKKIGRELRPAVLGLEWPCMRVNVTLRCDGKIRGSMSARGHTLGDQLRLAIAKTLSDRRFDGPVTQSEYLRTSIEVWIQLSAIQIPHQDRTNTDCMAFGQEGVEIAHEERFAYYKPSVAITSTVKNPQELFSALCKKAKIDEFSWQIPEATLRRTRWLCLMKEASSNIGLVVSDLRTCRKVDLDRATFALWINESCGYMRANQKADGSLTYLYYPLRNQVSPKAINIVRASGCLFALSQALEFSASAQLPTITDTALRLAQNLAGQTVGWKDGCSILVDKSSAAAPKLGATALYAAALSQSMLRSAFVSTHGELMNSLRAAQLSSGRFITNFGSEIESEKQVEFYSGQALLALSLSASEGDVEAREMCITAFKPYRDHFKIKPTTAFVGWHIDAWARLFMQTQNEEYATFSFDQCDWLLQFQVKEGSTDYLGGFSRNGKSPNYSSIVFVEAVLAALHLAWHLGDVDRISRYSYAARIGLLFCARLRLADVPNAFFPDPVRCAGGVSIGLIRKTVRCDIVQHFISMAISAIRVEHLLAEK